MLNWIHDWTCSFGICILSLQSIADLILEYITSAVIVHQQLRYDVVMYLLWLE